MNDKFNKEVVRLKHSSQNKNKSYNDTISSKQNKKTLPGRRYSINSTSTNIQTNTPHNYNSTSISKPSSSNNNNPSLNIYSTSIPKNKQQNFDKEISKNLKTPAFLYQFQNEVENRRMTIEMIKMMLKADPSYNNNPKSIVKELNLDSNILGLPDKIEPFNDEKIIKTEENKDSLESEQDDKLKFLYHLVTPKIVTIKYKKTKIPVLLKIVPSNICYTAGVEFYDLKMDSIENNKFNISIELLKIDRCFIIKDTSFSISLIKGEFFYKKKNSLKIYTKDKDETVMYALSLNYFSQLVKCKVYNKFYDKKV